VIEAINLAEKLDRFDAYWSPKIVGELNGQYVKLAKFKGEFVWHQHEAEDELFYVARPVAEQEVHVLLFEPRSTVNTGELQSERTRSDEWV
jgi:hypothetical protein